MSRHLQMRSLLALILLVALSLAAAGAHAVTLTVLSTADSGPFTLRQAIIAANGDAGADVIEFQIAASGVQTITPLTPLPTITQPLTIDGYSQPGASANTSSDASNAVLLIRIDGISAGGSASGLAICAPNTTIRGLSLTRFGQRGISIGTDSAGVSCGAGAANGSSIKGNFVGLAPDGSAAGNNRGIFDDGSVIQVGGSLPADRNVVSSNIITGIAFSNFGATDSTALGNLVGWDPSGTLARGNQRGISLAGSIAGSIIGSAAAPNRIGNNNTGIEVSAAADGNNLLANDVGFNSAIGIDLSAVVSPDGVTANDLDDVDSGGNGLQNFPVLSAVTRSAAGLSVSGTLDRPPGAALTYTLAFYASAACDPSGNGEGEKFLGSVNFASATGSAQTFANLALSTGVNIPIGSKITATATDQSTGNTSEFSSCFDLDAGASTFVVTSTADTAGTSCAAACTLRQALTAANAHAGADLITFNIPAAGVQTITPATALPTISDILSIDGYTQPGANENSAAEGSNADILIEIDAGANVGLTVAAANVSVRGLAVYGSTTRGILINGAASNDVVEGCFFGLRADGITARGNNIVGLDILAGSGHRIGGPLVGQRNILAASSASSSAGLRVGNAATGDIDIDGNLVGTDRSGLLARGSGVGIQVSNGAGNVRVGGRAPNTIRFNSIGLLVGSSSNAVNAYANHYSDNGGLGIDLSAQFSSGDGVTANDTNDLDSGGNGLQNFPVLGAPARVAGGISVQGTLDVGNTAAADFVIAIYASSACDTNGNGEGARYLGSSIVSLSSPTNEAFNFTLSTSESLPVGSVITATATTAAGSTSEFSQCKPLDVPTNFIVSKIADTGDGVCDSDCSLREAIVAANAHAGADTISFNIPGSGAKTINLATSLPSITDAVTVNGYSQPGSAVNTAAVGSNAVILIEVISPGTLIAFDVNADDVTIRGISLTALNFPIRVGGASPANNAVVVGNFVGLRASGTLSGTGAGVEVDRGLNAVIGGPQLADRNVISGSGASFGVAGNIDLRGLAAVSARIQGNYIGTDLSGAPINNGQKNGVLVRGSTSSALIGGESNAQFNVFAGNTAAIAVTSTASGIQVSGNEIGSNSGLGVDLIVSGSVGDGVTPNDVNDGDTGANNLQNFPLLSSAQFSNGVLSIAGTLDVPAATSNANYVIGIFQSAACDASGNGEGELYLGSANVTLSGDSAANQSFQFSLNVTPVGGGVVSAIATDAQGNSSEFSPCTTLALPVDALFKDSFE